MRIKTTIRVLGSTKKHKMSLLRLRRAMNEKSMKVLSFEITDDVLSFEVCGSTENEYTICFSNDQFTCTCPDFVKRRTFCKHVYLVFLKILQIVPNIDTSGNTIDTTHVRQKFEEYRSRPIEMREAQECPICFDDFDRPPFVCTACRNGFHRACIDEIISRGHSGCPMCRSELRTDIGVESNSVNSAVLSILKRR